MSLDLEFQDIEDVECVEEEVISDDGSVWEVEHHTKRTCRFLCGAPRLLYVI